MNFLEFITSAQVLAGMCVAGELPGISSVSISYYYNEADPFVAVNVRGRKSAEHPDGDFCCLTASQNWNEDFILKQYTELREFIDKQAEEAGL